MTHDSVSRWLSTAKLTPKLLWQQSQTLVNKQTGYLNDMSLTQETLKAHFDYRWTIEAYHREIKQCTGIERCSAVKERSQRNHILCSLLVFLRLEWGNAFKLPSPGMSKKL